MHICMIDEKTTQISKPTEIGRDLLSSLRKRAPIESLSPYPQLPKNMTARTSPSTFLFLLSSQCQRADPANATSYEKPKPLKNSTGNSSSSPVARQPPCPVKKNADQWEPQKLASSTFAGYMKVRSDCQHPFPEISQTVETESLFFPETHKRSFPTQPVVCSSPRNLAATSSAAVSGYIGGLFSGVNPLVRKTDKARIAGPVACGKLRCRPWPCWRLRRKVASILCVCARFRLGEPSALLPCHAVSPHFSSIPRHVCIGCVTNVERQHQPFVRSQG